MKKKIAIIGAGFFGISIAFFFLKKKFDVTIFEKNSDILTGASRANQLRFHLGYHYPRSYKTLNEIQSMNKSFISFFVFRRKGLDPPLPPPPPPLCDQSA